MGLLLLVGLLCLGVLKLSCVDQAGLEFRDPPASASHVLGLKECATVPGFISEFLLSTLNRGYTVCSDALSDRCALV